MVVSPQAFINKRSRSSALRHFLPSISLMSFTAVMMFAFVPVVMTPTVAVVEVAATQPELAYPVDDGPVGPVGPANTVVVNGIRVHESLAGPLTALLADAQADGLLLGGWGYRSSADQIRLRRQHCGSSEYAIYQMPSSQCRPPTARPGASMHERGLAVDFTCFGRPIAGTRCFRWLQANAARYGLYNLKSEPWHWSTNGR